MSAAMAWGDHEGDWAAWEAQLGDAEAAALRAHRRAARWRWLLPLLGAGALVATVIGALVLTAGIGPDRGRNPNPAPTPTASATPSPADPASLLPHLPGGR
ncbi:hypothetical protein GCM10010440_34260 [Kitasatospora cinereorecta]